MRMDPAAAASGAAGVTSGARFPGAGFFLTRLEAEEAAGQGYSVPGVGDITVSLSELLEPRGRLTNLFLVAGVCATTAECLGGCLCACVRDRLPTAMTD